MSYDNYSTEGAICPHCRHLNKAQDSDGWLYDESTEEWTCGECDKDLFVAVYVSHSWTTKAKDQPHD